MPAVSSVVERHPHIVLRSAPGSGLQSPHAPEATLHGQAVSTGPRRCMGAGLSHVGVTMLTGYAYSPFRNNHVVLAGHGDPAGGGASTTAAVDQVVGGGRGGVAMVLLIQPRRMMAGLQLKKYKFNKMNHGTPS